MEPENTTLIRLTAGDVGGDYVFVDPMEFPIWYRNTERHRTVLTTSMNSGSPFASDPSRTVVVLETPEQILDRWRKQRSGEADSLAPIAGNVIPMSGKGN